MIDLKGKTAVIFGLANKRSIAWAIAQNLHAAGANLAISYQNDRMKLEAEGLIADLPGARAFQCDVASDEEIDRMIQADVLAQEKTELGKLDELESEIAKELGTARQKD